MTLFSFLSDLRVRPLAALLLVACSNPPARPSQTQGQSQGDPAPAVSPRPPIAAAAPVNPEGEAPRPAAPQDPSTAAAPTPASPRLTPAQPVPDIPARPRPCIDIRPVLMRCKPGERLTHEGCPGPAYMQHCAPGEP
jgi:hypothetical protein